MIRKAIILVLILGAVACVVAWVAFSVWKPAVYPTVKSSLVRLTCSPETGPRVITRLGVGVTLTVGVRGNVAYVSIKNRTPTGQPKPGWDRNLWGFHWRSGVLPKIRHEAPAGDLLWTAVWNDELSFDEIAFLNSTEPYLRRIGMPLWGLCLSLGSYPGITFIRGPVRRWRRRRKGLCVKCDYDLTGNESGVCPECGTEVEEWRAPPEGG